MEVQVDIESKPSKFRHNSGSSSVDDGSAARSHPGVRLVVCLKVNPVPPSGPKKQQQERNQKVVN